MNNTITLMEDTAIKDNVSLDSMIADKVAKGYKEINRVNHPAVGIIVTMVKQKSYKLVPQDYLQNPIDDAYDENSLTDEQQRELDMLSAKHYLEMQEMFNSLK